MEQLQSASCTIHASYMVVKHCVRVLEDEDFQAVATLDQDKPHMLKTEKQPLATDPLTPVVQMTRKILAEQLKARFCQRTVSMTERRAMFVDPAIKLVDGLTHNNAAQRDGLIADLHKLLESVHSFLGPPKDKGSSLNLTPVDTGRRASSSVNIMDEALAGFVGTAGTTLGTSGGAQGPAPFVELTQAEAAKEELDRWLALPTGRLADSRGTVITDPIEFWRHADSSYVYPVDMATGTRLEPLLREGERFRLLPHLARMVLTPPAHSCDVERVFSQTGLILSPLRSTLKPTLVDDMLVISSWLDLDTDSYVQKLVKARAAKKQGIFKGAGWGQDHTVNDELCEYLSNVEDVDELLKGGEMIQMMKDMFGDDVEFDDGSDEAAAEKAAAAGAE